MPFGPHKGQHVEDLTTRYLTWVYERVPVKKPGRGCMGCSGQGMTQELHLYVEEELGRRKDAMSRVRG